MSTIALSIIIVFIVIFLFIGFIYTNNRRKKRFVTKLLSQLSQSGAENNLSFSSQELLNGSILGLDAMRLKLLVLRQDDEDTYERNIIDLKMVKSCAVKKKYKPFYNGKHGNKSFENHLEKIVLHFEFTDNREAKEIDFYSHINNNIYEMQDMEYKAVKWESILLQMKGNKLKQRA